ncbi:hypothetical protein M434DRAFT_20201 [Hypoxylon sp. CO27-5]|nr:hypothetical protein M434DRAFT_20201 [Hypoxylon sp. CO27-5]
MYPTAKRPVASQVSLSSSCLGICPGIRTSPPGAVDTATRLLQRNHDEHHIFWRDFAGHNHTVHNVLTRLALGATSDDLELGFGDNLPGQRPLPPVDEEVIRDMATDDGFYNRLGNMNHYTNYMVFFEGEIERKGWREVVNQYCFGRDRNSDAMLARMFDGAFHPIIHLGLGAEFDQPSIIAEALAQAATDASFNVLTFFHNAEKMAAEAGFPEKTRPLVELFHEARANETIRHAAHWDDLQFKMKNGVFKRSEHEIAALTAQFRVEPDTLERRTAEMISCCAYFSGGAQREGKARKIDFFYMHNVTSSIFLTVLIQQPWIRMEDKVRLVEWKSRLDLAWYATCGTPELNAKYIKDYRGQQSASWDWNKLFSVINSTHDDGHVAKYVRALKNGEQVSKLYEEGEWADAFPVKGDMWLKLSRMAFDSTVNLPPEQKWIVFAGFDKPWENFPSQTNGA